MPPPTVSDLELSLLQDETILLVRFNRPKRKNAFAITTYEEVVSVLNWSAAHPKIAVTVLTGNGDYFSSGNDLTNFLAADPSQGIEKATKDARDLLERFVASFIDYPKILIAAVNGPSIGIGTTLIGLCDFAYASDKATFHTPFVKLAQTPEACSSYTFPRLVGQRIAYEILVLGRKLTASEAKEARLVNDVFPLDTLIDKVMEIARSLASESLETLLAGKRVLKPDSERQLLHEVNKRECDELLTRWRSPELMAVVQRFMMRPRM